MIWMRDPFEIVKGRIVGYDERNNEMLIRAPYADWGTMVKRGYREVSIHPIDSRALSDKQRRTCYMLLEAISEYTGQGTNSTKEYMKLKFMVDSIGDTAETIFSLSNAPMSLVCAFENYLINFILEWDIPCSFPILKFVTDTNEYVYSCLMNKKCCICAKAADLHHVDRVGMGRGRNDIVHEGMEVLPLCREHHEETHVLPDAEFFAKYHLDGGIKLDKTLCRVWHIKSVRRENKHL